MGIAIVSGNRFKDICSDWLKRRRALANHARSDKNAFRVEDDGSPPENSGGRELPLLRNVVIQDDEYNMNAAVTPNVPVIYLDDEPQDSSDRRSSDEGQDRSVETGPKVDQPKNGSHIQQLESQDPPKPNDGTIAGAVEDQDRIEQQNQPCHEYINHLKNLKKLDSEHASGLDALDNNICGQISHMRCSPDGCWVVVCHKHACIVYDLEPKASGPIVRTNIMPPFRLML